MSPVSLLVHFSALALLGCSGDPVATRPPPAPPSPPAEIATVDGDGADGTLAVFPEETHQTIDGFGTSMRLFDDPHLNRQPAGSSAGGLAMTAAEKDTIYDLLYSSTRGIGLNRLRLAVSEPGWQREEGGPITPDVAYPGPHATDQVEFVAEALARNPELRTGFQVGRFDSWITKTTAPRKVAEYIKSILDFAKARGHEPSWVGVQNEPSIAMPNFSGEAIRDIIVELRKLLTADGRYSVTMSAPDDVTDAAGASKTLTILADPAARAALTSLSIHLYGDVVPDQMAAIAKQSGLPLWMTEYNAKGGRPNLVWAVSIVHEMLVTWDCAAVDMLFGFLGASAPVSSETSYISLNHEGLSYRGYTLNPSYYQMGQWSRYVKRGAVRIGASSSDAAMKVSAFMKDGKKVIVLINNDNGRTVSLSLPPGNYRAIRTQMRGTDRLSVKGVFKTALRFPPESITTLVEL